MIRPWKEIWKPPLKNDVIRPWSSHITVDGKSSFSRTPSPLLLLSHVTARKDLNELATALKTVGRLHTCRCYTPMDPYTLRNQRGRERNSRPTSAKGGGLLEQEDEQDSYQDEKTSVKTLMKRKWPQEHPNQKLDSYYISPHRLTKWPRGLLRLRTGHNRMRAHLYNNIIKIIKIIIII